MVNLLELSGNRIRLRHTDGRIALDTDEKLFQITDYLAGTHTAPSRTATFTNPGATQTPINIDLDTTLGAINAHADTIVGVFKVTTSDTRPGLQNKGWFNAGGTYVYGLDSISSAASAGSVREYVSGTRAFTFFAQGGFLKINERSVAVSQPRFTSPVTVTSTWPAITFDYRLYAGSFV